MHQIPSLLHQLFMHVVQVYAETSVNMIVDPTFYIDKLIVKDIVTKCLNARIEESFPK
jgi:hypothetical protein